MPQFAYTQVLSSIVADGSKLSALGSVQPYFGPAKKYVESLNASSNDQLSKTLSLVSTADKYALFQPSP